MTRSRGLVVPEARYVGTGKFGVSAIAKLHRWKDGANADDGPNRPWNTAELAWYNRVRNENLARRKALVARSMAMNGPPARIMPLEETRR